MTILTLVRNFVPAHEQIARGDWNVAAVAKNEYDLENKVVGTVAVGRIGERVLRRLKPFDCKELLYFDYQPLKPEIEKEIGCRRVNDLEEMLAQCDVVTINCPLHEKTRGLFNKELISKMKKGEQKLPHSISSAKWMIQAPGSLTPLAVQSLLRRTLPKLSNLVTSVVTEATSGSHNQHPRIILFATLRTPWTVVMRQCPTCLVHLLMLRHAMREARRTFSNHTSLEDMITDQRT